MSSEKHKRSNQDSFLQNLPGITGCMWVRTIMHQYLVPIKSKGNHTPAEKNNPNIMFPFALSCSRMRQKREKERGRAKESCTHLHNWLWWWRACSPFPAWWGICSRRSPEVSWDTFQTKMSRSSVHTHTQARDTVAYQADYKTPFLHSVFSLPFLSLSLY